jgi:CubicO group peptidase (beta-lactamase class C family)
MKQDMTEIRTLRALCLIGLCCAAAARAEPDEGALGQAQAYPVGTASTWYNNPYRVGSWSAMDRVPGLATRTVARGSAPVAPLPTMAAPPAIHYRYRNIGYTLDDYLARQRITGLLVLKDGQIVAEHYRYGRKDDARYLSFSMAKSVVSLLVGIALDKGLIASLDDPANKYATELSGSAYGATSLRALLRMSSGLVFTERYDGNDDVNRMAWAAATGTPSVLSVLRSIDERHAPAGEKFVYASAETEVLGRVLAGATGKPLAELTSSWLWQPMGAEQDAFWVLGKEAFWQPARDGKERASGFFNATLRDWGRLGLLLANDGRSGAGADATQIVPKDYLLDATDAARQPAAFQPRKATPYLGYGYQFWLLPMKTRTFALQGVHGQAVYVQPANGLVLVQTAAFEAASGRQDPLPWSERDAFWRGVLATLGGSLE